MLRLLIAFVTIAFLSVGAWCIPEARATEFAVEGYPGAKQRPVYCPDGMYMVGFRGMAGAFINQLGPICAPLLEDGRLGKRKKLTPHGGKGGSATFEQYCGRDEAIQQTFIHLNDVHRVIGSIVFRCASVVTGERGGKHVIAAPEDGRGFPTEPARCPSGELAGGVKINYGKHVNGLGLMCKEVIVPVAAALAPSEPAPPSQELATFAGTWDTTIAGVGVTLDLQANGRQVKGTMTSSEPNLTGNIYGKMDGRDYLYIAETAGGSTSGMLTLSDDGSSFNGGYRLDGNRMDWSGGRR